MRSSITKFGLFAACFLLTTIAGAQDLGSSNKLFGGAKAEKPAPKKAAPKKATTSKTRAERLKKPIAKASTPNAKRTTVEAKTAEKKKVEQKANAKVTAATPRAKAADKTTTPRGEIAKKPSNPSTGPDERTAQPNTIDGRFKAFGVTGKPAAKNDKTPSTDRPERPVTSADARRFEELIGKGAEARAGRNYYAAESAFSEARRIRPKDPRALNGLGALYADQQRWEEAEKAYRSAIEADPADPATQIALSYVLTQPVVVENLGDRYEDAEKFARKAIQSAPKNALAFDQLGAALELRGLIGNETESAYLKAIDLDPSFAPPYAHLARLLRRRGRSTESNAAYQKAIERATDAPTRVLVAEVMQSEQRFDESEKLLRYALEEDPRNPTALVLLGRVLTIQGHFKDAEIMYRRAADVSSNDYVPISRLAELYLRQGKLAEAERVLFEAQRSVPKSETPQLARQFEAVGDAHLNSGSRANAARCYRIASALDGESPTLPGKLARTVGSNGTK